VAKQQTRRAISIRGLTYQRIKDHCDAIGKPISGWIEEIVSEKLDELGVPESSVLRPRPPAPPRATKSDDFKGSHFTF
jgi:hypothetical protein